MTNVKVKWPELAELKERPILKYIDLCNVTMFRLAAFFLNNHQVLVVGIVTHGIYCFRKPNDYFRTNYVCEKLGLREADGSNITDWINAQFGLEDAPQQGRYHAEFVEEGGHDWNDEASREMHLRPTLIWRP